MSRTSAVSLDPANVASWAEYPFEVLLALPLAEVEEPQRVALARAFETLRPTVAALDKLAARQGVDRVDAIDDVIPVLFDHRVYKSYPLSLIEKRQFPRLTAWLDRLTRHDLTQASLDGANSVDSWLDRLDEHGMIVGHSTGTTGKLSFIPRSRTEWPAWKAAYFSVLHAATGVDTRTVRIPSFATGHRSGHQMMTKMGRLFAQEQAGGEAARRTLHDYALSSDLLSLAGRLQAAEERGELDELQIDPRILDERKQLIEASRHRDDDLRRWFAELAEEFRGQRVRIGGTSADLVRIALKGREAGIVCDFAPDSILMAGGGMKGFKDAPSNWEELLKDFFGIDRIRSMYGMSECMGTAPLCEMGFFHLLPYTIPILLDADARPLPRQGVQTGRLALFDLLAETYWGGFISGDRVTMHWDEDCQCGWKGPRIERHIVRFGELDGGDDKITCAGTAKAYNDFMDYVSEA
ncbi:hypothetical protein [Prauserella sp. PE36]|uniref:hypothetical protein n=1 Tax=Prauserella sp. PE36 TaxID=1504709 RepID=UPI0011BDEF95|nr:hypothetical protein [Prauserella sp. PE36]